MRFFILFLLVFSFSNLATAETFQIVKQHMQPDIKSKNGKIEGCGLSYTLGVNDNVNKLGYIITGSVNILNYGRGKKYATFKFMPHLMVKGKPVPLPVKDAWLMVGNLNTKKFKKFPNYPLGWHVYAILSKKNFRLPLDFHIGGGFMGWRLPNREIDDTLYIPPFHSPNRIKSFTNCLTSLFDQK